ncbi:uncharacterized protein LOC103669762 [Ursus maritimus]|uniref:Uncharacterized protein LOC103669762 n=1 Tax=Ursus maritimus TaxID=29073 RepID=A0A8M1GG17_URSMA|nr:uncharacterized protein LOC103669762 [Ursus maritimus]
MDGRGDGKIKGCLDTWPLRFSPPIHEGARTHRARRFSPGDAALGRSPRPSCISARSGREGGFLLVPAASPSGPEPSSTVPHLLRVVPFDPRRQQSRRPGPCELCGCLGSRWRLSLGRLCGPSRRQHPFLPRRTVVRSARCPPTPVCRAEACWGVSVGLLQEWPLLKSCAAWVVSPDSVYSKAWRKMRSRWNPDTCDLLLCGILLALGVLPRSWRLLEEA